MAGLPLFVFLAFSWTYCQANDVIHTPLSLKLSDLERGLKDHQLLQALTETGLVTVNLEDSGFRKARRTALTAWCECSSRDGHGVASVAVDDGITIRTTLATATVGSSPLALPETDCGEPVVIAMETLRDTVATVSDYFSSALDRLIGSCSKSKSFPLLYTNHGKTYHSLSSIRQEANHLEHFHHYQKTHVVEQETIRWHTDAGLFLAFVSSIDCSSGKEDSSFWIKQNGHELPVRLVLPENSVAIMLGTGMEQWIATGLQLHATPHAVQMRTGSSRAWYGMSKLSSFRDSCPFVPFCS